MIAQTTTQKTSGSSCLPRRLTTTKSPLGLSFALSAAVASAFLFNAPSVRATTYTYSSTGTTNWSTATWVGGTPVSNLDNVLSFTAPSGSPMVTSNNISSGFQLNGLALTNNTSTTNPQNLSIAGSSLNFVKNSSNVSPTITIAKANNSGTGALATSTITISAPFTVTDALTITSTADGGTTSFTGNITNTGGMTFGGTGIGAISLSTGVISGVGGITYGGSYSVTASGANTYTGGTTINTRLKIGNAKALGGNTSAASVTSGGVMDLNGTTMTNTNALTLNGTGISSGGALTNGSATTGTYIGLVTLGSASSISATTGSLILSNTGTITGSGFALTLDGAATGSSIASIIGTGTGTLTKQGTGTWTLSGANTYTGLTTVSAGALNFTSSGSLASGNDLTVGASGTADFAKAGQTLGAVSNANTASNALNFSASTGTVTLDSLSGAGNTRFGSNGTVTGGISSGTVNAVGLLTSNISGGTVGAGSLSASTVSGGTHTITGAAGITTLSNGTTTVGGVATIGTMSSGTANLNGATSAITTLNGGTVNLGSSTALTVSNGSSSGAITGSGGRLIKTSAGTLALSGANTYTGTTTVANGTLQVSGSIASSATTVDSGATLALSGSGIVGAVTVNSGTLQLGTAGIAGAVTINDGTLGGVGTVNSLAFTGASTFGPGNSPGTITIADGGTFTLSSGTTSTFQFTASTFAGGTFDLVTTFGSAIGTLAGTLNVDFTGTGYTAGSSVTFIDLTSISGTFSAVNVTGLDPLLVAMVNYDNDLGNVSLTLASAAIPEPSTYAALLGALALGTVVWRRNRRRTG